MRIVLDTNVFISSVFFGGQPGKILTAWRDGKIILVLSTEILEEVSGREIVFTRAPLFQI